MQETAHVFMSAVGCVRPWKAKENSFLGKDIRFMSKSPLDNRSICCCGGAPLADFSRIRFGGFGNRVLNHLIGNFI